MPLTEEELITSMIKDDLINYKLVMGLNKLGLVGEQYFLNASDTIFKQMGIKSPKDQDHVYERYEKLKREILRSDLERHPEKLDKIADKIYQELIHTRLFQKAKGKVSLQL